MAKYVICPRCELNYIDEETQEFCDVCVKELQGAKTFTDDLEENEIYDETELCPICGERYMRLGEKMCDECKKKTEYEEDEDELDTDKDDAWRTYLDDDVEDLGINIPDEEFEDEEEEEEEEDVSYADDEDDFEYVSADDYDPDEDDEEDDEDDDEF